MEKEYACKSCVSGEQKVMKVKCVCDLCRHGDSNNKGCYKRGITKCYVPNGYYKDFDLKGIKK